MLHRESNRMLVIKIVSIRVELLISTFSYFSFRITARMNKRFFEEQIKMVSVLKLKSPLINIYFLDCFLRDN